MTNEITKTEKPAANPMVIYDRIADPMAAIAQMGEFFCRSGMFGCEKIEQGQVLALACFSERKSPFDIMRTYHIIGGRLTMRSDAMLAAFRNKGGKIRWIQSDDHIAKAEFTLEGNALIREYTMEKARKAGLVRPKSAWDKTPDAMLRARLITETITMICPEVRAGSYTPEELDGEIAETVAASSLLPTASMPVSEPIVNAEEVMGPVLPPDLPETGDPLEAFLLPYEERVNAYLANVLEWITSEETWRDLSEPHKTRISAAPDAFIGTVMEATNGK